MAAKKPTKKLTAVTQPAPVSASVDAQAVRNRLTSKIVNAADDIVGAVIETAKTGNYLHAKFLFEFAGIMQPASQPESEVEAQARVRSLAEILLDAVQNAPADNVQETPIA